MDLLRVRATLLLLPVCAIVGKLRILVRRRVSVTDVRRRLAGLLLSR